VGAVKLTSRAEHTKRVLLLLGLWGQRVPMTLSPSLE
jgi:hypothetical protein